LARGPVRTVVRRLVLRGLDGVAGLQGRPARYVLILGHMRSGSTLVNHVLISHPDLSGCGELNATYGDADVLDTTRLRILRYDRSLLRPPRYFVDQINHSRMTPEPALLDDPRVRTIFLLRQPGPTLGSLVKTLGPLYGKTYDDGPDYYLERVATLAALARGLAAPSRALALSYEALLREPAAELARLTAFLALRTPLSEEYQQFDFTGRRGDPGPVIRTGRITADKATHDADLPSEVMARLGQAHADCWATLQSCCRG